MDGSSRLKRLAERVYLRKRKGTLGGKEVSNVVEVENQFPPPPIEGGPHPRRNVQTAIAP